MGFMRKGDIKLRDQEPRVSSYWDTPADVFVIGEEDPFTDRPGTVPGKMDTMFPQSRLNHVRSPSEGLESLIDTPTIQRGRDAGWHFEGTPTKTKSVGDSGFVKDEVKLIERHAGGGVLGRPNTSRNISG